MGEKGQQSKDAPMEPKQLTPEPFGKPGTEEKSAGIEGEGEAAGEFAKDEGIEEAAEPFKDLQQQVLNILQGTVDTIRSDKMDQLLKMNETLVSILTDVGKQSKVQTGLLNTLAAEAPKTPTMQSRASREPQYDEVVAHTALDIGD